MLFVATNQSQWYCRHLLPWLARCESFSGKQSFSEMMYLFTLRLWLADALTVILWWLGKRIAKGIVRPSFTTREYMSSPSEHVDTYAEFSANKRCFLTLCKTFGTIFWSLFCGTPFLWNTWHFSILHKACFYKTTYQYIIYSPCKAINYT